MAVPQSRPVLSEDTVVAAAIRIARRSGIETVTMRALAAELGVTQMAAYYYFPTKEKLLEQVLDGILSTIEIPEPGSGPWDELLRRLVLAELRELAKYRGIGRVRASLNATPGWLAVARAYIDILTSGGFSSEDAFMAFDMIHSHVVGRLLLLDRVRESPRRMEELLDIPPMANMHFEDYAKFAVDVMVNGLKIRQAFGPAR